MSTLDSHLIDLAIPPSTYVNSTSSDFTFNVPFCMDDYAVVSSTLANFPLISGGFPV